MSKLYPNIKRIVSQKRRQIQSMPFGLLDWTLRVRPKIDRREYSFVPYPFWEKIYQNNSKRMMVMAGRQVFKSTWFANILAHTAVMNPGSTAVYVTHDEPSLSGFSNHKFRHQTLNENPILRKMCSGKKSGKPGSRREVFFNNGSVVYLVTDEGGYSQVEGKSVDEILLDEAQYQELESISVAKEALATTRGNLKIAGIGGEGGSPLEDEWLQTTQSEWVFDDPNWRSRLKFDKNGLVYGDYLKSVMKGRWIAKEPKNSSYPGYHLPQSIFPHIPLYEKDALELYRLPVDSSIEFKRKSYPRSVFISHVQGGFYKAARRPITREMVLACMSPYRYMSLMRPLDVIDIKQTFRDRVNVFMGIDWGSGKAGTSQTVVCILLKFRGINDGRFSADRDRYCIAWIERREQENSIAQARYMRDLFVKYGCDFGVADLGYGHAQVEAIIEGGSDPHSCEKFPGLGHDKFQGAWTRNSVTSVSRDEPTKLDEEGNEEISHILIDKTEFLQNLIDLMDWRVLHPIHEENSRPKLMIPYGKEHEVDFLIKDFTSIKRHDLEPDITAIVEDPRQVAKKKFKHPPDSVMSIIYALQADKHYYGSGDFSGTHKKTRRARKLI